jgi:hypothetical protein
VSYYGIILPFIYLSVLDLEQFLVCIIKNNVSGAGSVAHWKSACLACARPWVQSLAQKKEK